MSENPEKVLVNDIQGYSIHDGPGIRTTVFLKGCNLDCQWCQNPEGMSLSQQVGFMENLCQGCGKCLKACQHGAIVATPGEHRVDYSKCVVCGDCVEACYYGALVMYGKPMTAQELFEEARKDRLFYDATEGGVTISGGEPLIHPEFVHDVLVLLKEDGINTAIETAGCVPWKTFELVADYVDLFLFDFKMADPARHEHYIGKPNDLILENAEKLVKRGANVLFRMPLLKGVNDSDENIAAMSEFAKKVGNPHIQLMPYHRMAENKYKALNKPYRCEEVPVMDKSEVEAVRLKFVSHGIDCTTSK